MISPGRSVNGLVLLWGPCVLLAFEVGAFDKPEADNTRTLTNGLQTRVFKVDTNVFGSSLNDLVRSNLFVQFLRDWFDRMELDFSAPGRNLQFSKERMELTVTATGTEMEQVEDWVLPRNYESIGIQVNFVELELTEDERKTSVPHELRSVLDPTRIQAGYFNGAALVGIVSTQTVDAVLLELRKRKDVLTSKRPEIVTGGWQIEVEMFPSNSIPHAPLPRPPVPLSPVVEITPYTRPDGSKLDLFCRAMSADLVVSQDSANADAVDYRRWEAIVTRRVEYGQTLVMARIPGNLSEQRKIENGAVTPQRKQLLMFITPRRAATDGK